MAPDLSYIVDGLRPLAVPIADLTEDPENARVHGPKNLAAIRSSFERYGQVKPIAVRRRDMVVLAGNGRLRVAKKLGWTHIAAILMDGTEEQLRAFALLDNKSAELAEWDEAALSELVSSMAADHVDLTDLGFRQDELDRLVDVEEVPVPEAPVEAPPEPVAPPVPAPSAPPKAPKKPAKAAKTVPVWSPSAAAIAALETAAEAMRAARKRPLSLDDVIISLANGYEPYSDE